MTLFSGTVGPATELRVVREMMKTNRAVTCSLPLAGAASRRDLQAFTAAAAAAASQEKLYC